MQNRLSISNEIRSIKSKFDYSNYAPIPTTTTTIATTTANEDEQGNALDETTNADETANADETGTSDETANTDEGRRKRNIPQTTTLVRNKLK